MAQLQVPFNPRQYACLWKYAELLPQPQTGLVGA
jgi:hypothetical protein